MMAKAHMTPYVRWAKLLSSLEPFGPQCCNS